MTGWSFAVLGICLAFSASAEAQPVRWIALDEWGGELGFRYRFEDETRERLGSSDLHEIENVFEERVGALLDGSVYHPRLLKYHLYGALLFQQQDIRTNSSTPGIDNRTTDTEYDAIVSILEQHPVSFRFIARQRIREVRQSFFQNTELTNTNYEGNAYLKFPGFPIHLQARRGDVEGKGFQDTDERRDAVVIEGSHSGRTFFADARYEHGTTDIFTTDQNFTIDTASGSIRKRWGEELRNLWAVTGYYRDQTGSIETTTQNATASSRHQHSETLSSEIRVLYQDSSAFSTDTQGLSEDASITHQLYESLTTTVRVGASQNDFSEGRSDSWRGGAEAAYRKRIPGGRMRLGLEWNRERIDEQGLGGLGSVVNEPHTVQFGLPIFLDRTFVIVTSIVVTDLSGTVVYSEGTDYIVSAAGERTRIDIPPASLIVDGQTILSTYLFQSSPDRVFDRDRAAADLTLDFGSQVSLYGRWSELDENLVTGSGDTDLDTQRRSEAGVILGDVRRRLSVRYIDFESRFNPYERLQGTASVSRSLPFVPFRGRGSLRFDAFHSRFPDDHSTERGYDAAARADFRITRLWTGRAQLEYRWLDDRIERSTGLFAEAGIRYAGRAWGLDAVLQQSFSHFEISTDDDRTRFEIRVIRRFGGRTR